MQNSFLKIESYKKGIAFSTAFNFVSKFLLFAQSIAIAFYFGTQDKTDVFFYCFAIVTLTASVINNLDSYVLIPEAMRLREQEGERKSMLFVNFFIYGYIALGLAITAILFLAPVKIFLFMSSFDLTVLEQNKEVLLLSIPLFILMIVTNLLVNTLASYKFFTLPMIIGTINGAIVLVSLFFFHNVIDIMSLLLGQLFAYAVNIIFLIFLMKKYLMWDFAFQRVKISKHISKNIFYAQVGSVFITLTNYFPMYLLSGFGTGYVSSLTYGQKTAEIPNQLITNQVSAVTGIRFNELHAKKDTSGFNRVFLSTMELLLFALVPVSFLGYLFSEDLLKLLYQRGAFNLASVETSILFFKYIVLVLPMYAINTIVSRAYMASQITVQPVIYQITINLALIVATFVGVKQFGVVGYPIALIAYYITNVVLSYFMMKALLPKVQYGKAMLFFAKVILLNCAVFVLIGYWMVPLMKDLPVIIEITISTILYFSLLIIANSVFKLQKEIDDILTNIRHRLLAVRNRES